MSKVNFEDTPLWFEVQDIIKNSKGPKSFKYIGTIHTELEDIGVWDLRTIEKARDFFKDFGDTAKVRFKIGLGDYINRFWPQRDNLEFTLKRTPMEEGGVSKKQDENIVVTRYKAVFNQKKNPAVGSSDLQSASIEELNVSDIIEVELELLDRSLEPLRIKTTSGIFKDEKLQDFIRATMSHESNQVLVDGKPAIEAFDLALPDNVDKIKHMIIPSGLHLTSLTTYLQKEIGIYNQGLGTYYTNYRGKKTWFVYPLYDTERFDKKGRKAIFYLIPQEKLPQLDRSYWEDGDVLKVAITAQRTYNDSAGLAEMNKGTGFRLPDARAFMKKPVICTEKGPMVNRARLNHEVVTELRKDGLNYAPVVTSGAFSNIFAARTDAVARSRAQMDFVWEGADEELLFPGMPCKCVYLSQGKVKEVKGTLLFSHSLTSRIEKNNAQAYRTTARLTIACEIQKDIPDLETRGVQGEE